MMQLGPGEKLEQGKEISHRGLKICVYSSVHDLTVSPSLQQIFSESQCELLIQLALLLDCGKNLYIRCKTEN